VSNQFAKQTLLSFYFKNWDYTDFKTIADQYALTKIDLITRPKAIKQIKKHQAQGDQVVIVSASISLWLEAWCEQHQIILIATQFEIKDHKITGKFATKNCFGAEKVNRIKAQFDLTKISKIMAYGDSSGDKEMLALADKALYRHFE